MADTHFPGIPFFNKEYHSTDLSTESWAPQLSKNTMIVGIWKSNQCSHTCRKVEIWSRYPRTARNPACSSGGKENHMNQQRNKHLCKVKSPIWKWENSEKPPSEDYSFSWNVLWAVIQFDCPVQRRVLFWGCPSIQKSRWPADLFIGINWKTLTGRWYNGLILFVGHTHHVTVPPPGSCSIF